MGIFRKEGIDVLDIPSLQKKGILKRAGYNQYEREMQKDMSSGLKVTDGFFDLTSMQSKSESSSMNLPDLPSPSLPQSDNSSMFMALDNIPTPPSLPGPGEPTNPFSLLDNPTTFSTSNSSFSNAPVFDSTQTGNSEVNALKLKIDDLEYKLGNLIEKLSLIEDHLKTR